MKPDFLNGTQPCQIGMIVKDIEAAKRRWAAFLGVAVPATVGCGDYSVTKTVYMDNPAPEAACEMAFFELGNVQLELIAPNGADSTWRDHLLAKGEGIHHYGYPVKDIFESMAAMKNAGYVLTQWGYYGDGNGAYAYFDCTGELGCFIELLCSF